MTESSVSVLLVTDNPGDVTRIEELLRRSGDHGLNAAVTSVSSLDDALALCARQQCDAMLLDLGVPDAAALDTLKRAVAGARNAVVLVLASVEDVGLARQAMERGAEDYLFKDELDARLCARAISHAIERQHAHAALQSAEDRYHCLWDASPLAKIVVDAETLQILEVNRAATRQYGYEVEEFAALPVTALLPDDDAPRLLAALVGAPDQLSENAPMRHRRRDGSVFDAEIAASTIICRQRRARIFTVHDVTARQRAIARTEQLLAVTAALIGASTSDEVAQRVTTRVVEVLGASSATVAMLNPDGKVVRLLAGANLSPAMTDAWHAFPLTADCLLAEAIRTGTPHWRRSSHEAAECGPMVMPNADHHAGGCAVLPLAIAERVSGAIGIRFDDRCEFAPLDQEVFLAIARQCGLALERAQLFEAEQLRGEAAQMASAAKSEFLAAMSHELRTPLTAILGFVELMDDGIGGPVTSVQQDYLARVRRSAVHLLSLINDVLTLSRLEAQRELMREETVRAADLVEEAVSLLEPSARSKGITLAVERPVEPILLSTDSGKVRQILLNLLANAVKFTERGSVHVAVVRQDGQLHVTVRDTGIGIAPEHLSHIFEPYWQVRQGATGSVGGTGLGLNVSLRLARLLGGDLLVQSTPGAGSRFTLVLPGAAESAAAHDGEREQNRRASDRAEQPATRPAGRPRRQDEYLLPRERPGELAQ